MDVLYTICEQIYRKSIILVTNYKTWIENLDLRVKSRLMPEIVEFMPYNISETREILLQRRKYAFQPNVWENDAFEEVIKKSVSVADIRAGLYLMREAGHSAAESNSDKITTKHVKNALTKMDEFTIKNSNDLDETCQIIYEIIKKNPNKKIGDLFKVYEKTGTGLTYKTFQRKIDKLEKSGFIETEKITGGKDGKTTIINLKEQNKKLNDF
jgi:archaeal cell division control protein 6